MNCMKLTPALAWLSVWYSSPEPRVEYLIKTSNYRFIIIPMTYVCIKSITHLQGNAYVCMLVRRVDENMPWQPSG